MNKNKVAARFNRAAQTYDRHAVLQKTLGNHLLERAAKQKLEPVSILDLGCGTGFFTNKLSEAFPCAKILGVDIADKMIALAQAKYQTNNLEFMHADADNLSPAKYDLIFSNCVLQWMPNLKTTFKKIKEILGKNGALFFASFIDGTLQELQNTWKEIDDRQHINKFATPIEIKNTLHQMRFVDISLECCPIKLKFNDLMELVQYLRNIGANYAANYNSGLLGAKTLKRMSDIYQNKFSENNKIIATFNVIYGYARN